MDECRIKIPTKVLYEVKTEFPQAAEFIDDLLQQECLKKNISAKEVIFLFASLEATSFIEAKIFLIL